ncbi:MAG: hypothetical protein WB983_13630, partial [Terriglobales bacterium]
MLRTPPSQAAPELTSMDERLNGVSRTQTTETAHATGSFQIDRGKRRSWRWIKHLLLVLLVGGFIVKGFVPAWRHLNSDFPNYYLVARLYRAGYPLERVYDWTWLQRQKDRQGIDQRLVSFIPST